MIDGNMLLTEYGRGRKIRARGIDTFDDLVEFADGIGRKIARMLNVEDFAGAAPAEIEAALLPVMRKAYGDVSGVALGIQTANLRKLGLGLSAVGPEFNADAIRELAEELAGREFTAEFLENLIAKQIIKGVDDTVRANAEANAEMGLKTHIIRTYSDVGLMQGTKYAQDCEWCLSRCGEWDDVREAISAGAFERHPGCLCRIEYMVGRTHTVSTNRSNWRRM